MPVLKCVSEEFQELMRGFIKKKSKNETIVAHFIASLEDAVPVCAKDMLIEFAQDGEISSGTDGGAPKAKKKRKPSPYNNFISVCLKDRPEGQVVTDAMKSCGPQWKTLSDSEKEKYKK